MIILYVFLGLAIVFALWVAGSYNSFVKFRVRADEAWADIDVQLKRRYDLIPNLIESVKGYASHEQETLEKLTKARSEATSINIDPNLVTSGEMAEFAKSQGEISQALGKLLAISENYPDLKANENFLELQRELSDTENKIQASRRFFNTNVKDLNIKVDSFPSNIIAGWFGFQKREFFDLPEDSNEREPVKVQF